MKNIIHMPFPFYSHKAGHYSSVRFSEVSTCWRSSFVCVGGFPVASLDIYKLFTRCQLIKYHLVSVCTYNTLSDQHTILYWIFSKFHRKVYVIKVRLSLYLDLQLTLWTLALWTLLVFLVKELTHPQFSFLICKYLQNNNLDQIFGQVSCQKCPLLRWQHTAVHSVVHVPVDNFSEVLRETQRRMMSQFVGV